MKKNIIVTGANGQLGLTIKELSISYEDMNFHFVTKSELDITNKTDLETFFKEHTFDYCINCAAYTNVEQAEKTPDIAFKVNAEGVKNLAEVCKETKVHLVHISTDYVFDGEKETPYTIDDTPNPINEYGKSKLLGEQYIQDILKTYSIIRVSWLYSKTYGHNFYKTILQKAKTEKELYITDEQIGCPTDANDLAVFVLGSISNLELKSGISHFTGKEIMTWYRFSKQIITENELNTKVVARKYTTFARRPKNSVLE